MIGLSPVTVTVSSSAPTLRSALIVAVSAPSNSTPSRLKVLKPGNVNVTEYVPGRRSTIRYCPPPSVTTVRTFSMSTGLLASTVTPGSTAPDVSFTVPVIVACANAMVGMSTARATRCPIRTNARITYPPDSNALQRPRAHRCPRCERPPLTAVPTSRCQSVSSDQMDVRQGALIFNRCNRGKSRRIAAPERPEDRRLMGNFDELRELGPRCWRVGNPDCRSRPLDEGGIAACRNTRPFLGATARPEDLRLYRLRRSVAKTNEHTRIVGRCVAAVSTRTSPHHRAVVSDDRDARPERVS